jgi:hypothetical protein
MERFPNGEDPYPSKSYFRIQFIIFFLFLNFWYLGSRKSAFEVEMDNIMSDSLSNYYPCLLVAITQQYA